MRFFRNQEVQRLCVLLGVVAAAASAVGFVRDLWTGLAALGGVLAAAVTALLFTAWRYREIEKLAGFLKRIAGGEYALDVRDVYKRQILPYPILADRVNNPGR